MDRVLLPDDTYAVVTLPKMIFKDYTTKYLGAHHTMLHHRQTCIIKDHCRIHDERKGAAEENQTAKEIH
jgi:hypothetical protein